MFELGFRDAVLTIIFFNLLSTLPVAYFATWGAKLGLRQMTIGRFSFGYWSECFPREINSAPNCEIDGRLRSLQRRISQSSLI